MQRSRRRDPSRSRSRRSDCAVAGLLALGTYWASRRIARPILAITDTAEAVAAGDLDREAPVTTNDEVGKLAVAFNSMTGRLRETLEGLELRVAERTGELAKQNVELEALNETSVGIMQRLDLDELLRELIARAGTIARHSPRLRLPRAPWRGRDHEPCLDRAVRAGPRAPHGPR